MGVYIPNMEMPKNCDECYIREKDTCPLTKTNVTGWGILLNCPLVEIPPHGRLIDADALQMEAHKRLMMCNKNNNQIHKPYEMMKAIVCAPTIIEAEEGE